MIDERELMDICDMKCKLISCLQTELSKGIDHVNADEAGEVVDMIKDLAEAKKYCYEADYYKTVIEAMNGQYERQHYKPYLDQEPYVKEHLDSKYGKTYDDYQKSKRYYTETKSPERKTEMDDKASEYVNDTLVTIRDIWKDADPDMRRKLKADFVKLVNEMNI